jgi:sulfur relay (sulfurtransferase) DsrC/TusE family protein
MGLASLKKLGKAQLKKLKYDFLRLNYLFHNFPDHPLQQKSKFNHFAKPIFINVFKAKITANCGLDKI